MVQQCLSAACATCSSHHGLSSSPTLLSRSACDLWSTLSKHLYLHPSPACFAFFPSSWHMAVVGHAVGEKKPPLNLNLHVLLQVAGVLVPNSTGPSGQATWIFQRATLLLLLSSSELDDDMAQSWPQQWGLPKPSHCLHCHPTLSDCHQETLL